MVYTFLNRGFILVCRLLIEDKKCDNHLPSYLYFMRKRLRNKELICAEGLRAVKRKNLFMDTCKGDSGGPILCKDGGKKNFEK